MPIDHFHNISRYEPHTNATFQQLYWVDTSNYVPGGPVIIHAMGEDSPDYDLQLLQKGILHDIANATGGAAILWGQRYVDVPLRGDGIKSQPDTTVAAMTSSQTPSTPQRIFASIALSKL